MKEVMILSISEVTAQALGCRLLIVRLLTLVTTNAILPSKG